MDLPLISAGMTTFILSCLFAFFAAGIGVSVTLVISCCKFKPSKGLKYLIVFVLLPIGLLIFCLIFYIISSILGQYQVEKRFVEMDRLGGNKYLYQNIPREKADNGVHFYEAAKGLMIYPSCQTLSKLFLNNNNDITSWKEEDRKLLSNKEVDQIVELFHQGAEKPVAVYYRDYTLGPWLPLPELSTQRELFRLLYAKSIALGMEGKASAGYTIISDGFRVVKQFESEPILISQLVNLACIHINIDAMNTLLDYYGIDEQTARQLLNDLNKLDLNHTMIHAMDGELIITKDFFKWFQNGDTRFENAMAILNTSYLSKPGMKIVASFFFYWDYNYFLTNMLKVRGLFSEPYWKVTDKIKELDIEHKNIPLYYPISKTIMPALSQTKVKTAKTESEIACAKVKLALHIYKNEHGEFPEKLEQLSKILTVIPVDPMTGNALSYSKDGTLFKLSCTWLDEKAKKAKKK